MENLPQLTLARPQDSSLKPCGMRRLEPMLLLSKATKMGCISCFRESQVGRAVRRRGTWKANGLGRWYSRETHAMQAEDLN